MDPVVVCMRMTLHRVIYLNSWSPVGETVWERLGYMVLFGEICHWRQMLGFQKSTQWPYHSQLALCALCLWINV